jgi:predicted protein tyrosine phosphatase
MTEAPFRLTICGIAELGSYEGHGVTHVVSILDPGTPLPPAFHSYPDHVRLDLTFDDIIEESEDEVPPGRADVERVLAFGRTMLARSVEVPHLLVHCHMGISRSTAAAALLIAQAEPETPAEAIIARIAAQRPKAWPNLRMIEFGDAILGRQGTLVAAVRARHYALGQTQPEVVRFMASVGRHREIEGLEHLVGEPAA